MNVQTDTSVNYPQAIKYQTNFQIQQNYIPEPMAKKTSPRVAFAEANSCPDSKSEDNEEVIDVELIQSGDELKDIETLRDQYHNNKNKQYQWVKKTLDMRGSTVNGPNRV